MKIDPKEVSRQRCDDALMSSISLLRVFGRDDKVVHVAIQELEFVRTTLEAQAAEQAVTDAMVEAALVAWINAPSPLDAAMRSALKAAMEAGR